MATSERGVFKVLKYDEKYWEDYLAARPKYHRDGFYDRLLTYHDVHSGLYDVAHDVGTGPGQVAEVLSRRFRTVVASDANGTHLSICKHRNQSIAGQMSFVLCKGEEIATKVPAASADAVFSGEALALMDTAAAITSFAKMLKPSGTLAIWYYGRPTFVDGDKDRCQELYNKIVNTNFRLLVERGGPAAAAGWKGATEVMASWLDCVALPGDTWKDVERYKWNTHGEMTFYDEEAYPYPIDRKSAIGEGEKVIEMEDRTMWEDRWDINEVRRWVDANNPGFAENREEVPEVERWYKELGNAMGGTEAKRTIAWPVVLLLATKR